MALSEGVPFPLLPRDEADDACAAGHARQETFIQYINDFCHSLRMQVRCAQCCTRLHPDPSPAFLGAAERAMGALLAGVWSFEADIRAAAKDVEQSIDSPPVSRAHVLLCSAAGEGKSPSVSRPACTDLILLLEAHHESLLRRIEEKHGELFGRIMPSCLPGVPGASIWPTALPPGMAKLVSPRQPDGGRLPPVLPSAMSKLVSPKPAEEKSPKKLSKSRTTFTSMDAEDQLRRVAAEELDDEDEVIQGGQMSDADLRLPPWRRTLRAIVRGNAFEILFTGAVILNAIFMGVEVDIMVGSTLAFPPVEFQIGRGIFTLVFFVEIVLRLAADGPFFFWDSNWAWNYLDVFIVTASIFETIIDVRQHLALNQEASVGASHHESIRIMRIIRITRIIRVVRVTRVVRFVRALRTLVHSILSTLKALVWAMVLLCMIIYVFGIIFAQGANDQLISASVTNSETRSVLVRYWGSLPRSMYTLFKCMTNGVDWDMVVHPLEWYWVALFMIYISFAYFAVLNVVTGVFCQSAIESAQHDQDMVIQGQIQNKSWYVQRTKQLFKDIDIDNSGVITFRQLERILSQPLTRQYFASLDIEPDDAWSLFKLLDQDHSNFIELDEFIEGCMRIRGSARSIDMARLMYEHRWLTKQLAAWMEACVATGGIGLQPASRHQTPW